jgi:hypothetical protein
MASNVWKSSTGRYTFDSAPQPISAAATRPKYRSAAAEEAKSDELEKTLLATTSNIMFDPRVVRGITLGQPIQVANRANISSLRADKMSREQQLQKRKVIATQVSFNWPVSRSSKRKASKNSSK